MTARPDGFLTKKQLAERLGRSIRTVDAMIQDDLIRGVTIGRRKYYYAEYVLEMLRERARPSSDLGERETEPIAAAAPATPPEPKRGIRSWITGGA
jgi:hypothetical protein